MTNTQTQIVKCLLQFTASGRHKSLDEYNIQKWCGFPADFTAALAELVSQGAVVKAQKAHEYFMSIEA